MCLAEFWSRYDILYQKKPKLTGNIILLKNGSFIRRRFDPAVLRYYLTYGNDEDLARGLLVLFHPFRNELDEIHRKDVQELLDENREMIEAKRKLFEKYKLMTELISNIQSTVETENKDDSDEEIQPDEEIETTDKKDIVDFNLWAKN